MSRLIWIYAVCKSLSLPPVAVEEVSCICLVKAGCLRSVFQNHGILYALRIVWRIILLSGSNKSLLDKLTKTACILSVLFSVRVIRLVCLFTGVLLLAGRRRNVTCCFDTCSTPY